MLNMKKKVVLALFSLSLGISASALSEVSKDKLSQIQDLNLIKKASIEVKKAYDLGSLYALDSIIQGQNQELYLTKDTEVLIAGEAINTNTGQKLSIPADVSKLEGNEAFTFGSGEDEYYLFTDPECPYCKKFESYLKQVEDKVSIKVFYYPLDFHENAKDISLYVMSQDTKEKKSDAMINITKNSKEFKNRDIDEKKLAKLEKSLEKQMQLAKELGVRGTPSIYDKKGNKISWVKLLQDYGVKVDMN
ncbi:MAG: DsbC family protein [Campylobacterota bacterium]